MKELSSKELSRVYGGDVTLSPPQQLTINTMQSLSLTLSGFCLKNDILPFDPQRKKKKITE